MSSKFSALTSVPVDATREQFWKSIEVFLCNPRIASKNVAGIVLDLQPIARFKASQEAIKSESLTRFTDISVLSTHLQSMDQFEKLLTLDELKENLQNPCDGLFVWIVKILYKNIKRRAFSHKCYILDLFSDALTVIPLRSDPNDSSSSLPYRISLSPGLLSISTDESIIIPPEDKTREWLQNAVIPRLTKLMEKNLSSSSEKSLRLVDVEEYNELYNSLKEKYGPQMISIWPEVTDPAKFVYEDVAIATYLLLIWRKERLQINNSSADPIPLQSFVDLGCGNGLLVYILTMEGHKGFGIDLRKRNIWDWYPKEVDLRVESIVPSDENLYPNTDWIIGNHSDELSPWVPVIAARSSPKCRFFLLPCCAFDFNGKKYQRKQSNVSQYESFIEYAKQISSVCGYATEVDRLKIPSTKRICLIGFERRVKDLRKIHSEISTFVRRGTLGAEVENVTGCGEGGGGSGGDPVKEDVGIGGVWSSGFKPREAVEGVRNCTMVNKSVVAEIVEMVFKAVIQNESFEPSLFAGKWNVGQGVALPELAAALPKDKLVQLKCECGGLQTLLRNHNQIFEVRGGRVQMRVPVTIAEKRRQLEEGAKRGGKKGGRANADKPMQFQVKACYFNQNHPQGCPLEKEVCTFRHDE